MPIKQGTQHIPSIEKYMALWYVVLIRIRLIQRE